MKGTVSKWGEDYWGYVEIYRVVHRNGSMNNCVGLGPYQMEHIGLSLCCYKIAGTGVPFEYRISLLC